MNNLKKMFTNKYKADPLESILSTIADYGLMQMGQKPTNVARMDQEYSDAYQRDIDAQKALEERQRQDQLMGIRLNEDARAGEKMMRENDASQAFTDVINKRRPDLGLEGTGIQGEDAYKLLSLDEQAALRRQLAAQNASNRKDEKSSKLKETVSRMIEGSRGANPAARQAELDLYNADKVNSLANLYGDPNKLSPNMLGLLVSEVGKIAKGGVPTTEEFHVLNPDTAQIVMAKMGQKLSGNPTPAQAGEFVKQYNAYTNAVARDAKRVIQNRNKRVVDLFKRDLQPYEYDDLVNYGVNRFDNEEVFNSQEKDKKLKRLQELRAKAGK